MSSSCTPIRVESQARIASAPPFGVSRCEPSRPVSPGVVVRGERRRTNRQRRSRPCQDQPRLCFLLKRRQRLPSRVLATLSFSRLCCQRSSLVLCSRPVVGGLRVCLRSLTFAYGSSVSPAPRSSSCATWWRSPRDSRCRLPAGECISKRRRTFSAGSGCATRALARSSSVRCIYPRATVSWVARFCFAGPSTADRACM